MSSYPLSANQFAAFVESSKVTFLSINWASSCNTNLSTTLIITSFDKGAKLIVASNLFLNSGEKVLSIAAVSSPSLLSRPKPIASFACSEAPAFDVMIRITFLKSVERPLWSVNFPWSITWSKILNTSGCAFSISSKSKTQWGFWSTPSVNKPPWSKPTYPGGAPISLLMACFSMYSDISNLINSTPNVSANCFATSVLPTPVGPANK